LVGRWRAFDPGFGSICPAKNETSSPEDLLRGAAAANSLNGSETTSPENPDLHMDLAFQLYNAGKFAEALQSFARPPASIPMTFGIKQSGLVLAANPRRELRNGKEAVQLASQAVELTASNNRFSWNPRRRLCRRRPFAKADEMAKRACDTALLNNSQEWP